MLVDGLLKFMSSLSTDLFKQKKYFNQVKNKKKLLDKNELRNKKKVDI